MVLLPETSLHIVEIKFKIQVKTQVKVEVKTQVKVQIKVQIKTPIKAQVKTKKPQVKAQGISSNLKSLKHPLGGKWEMLENNHATCKL